MSGKKGVGHRNCTKAEKLSYVLQHLEEHVARESVKNSSLGNSHRNSGSVNSFV